MDMQAQHLCQYLLLKTYFQQHFPMLYLLIKQQKKNENLILGIWYYKCKTTKNSTTTHVVNYKGCIIVIKNVPCEECEQCGEKYYSGAVVEKLEKIVDTVKKLMQEVAVVDYNLAA